MMDLVEFADFMKGFWRSKKRELLVGCVGEIQSHNTTRMTADVRPLLKFTQQGQPLSEDYAVIPDLPVAYTRGNGFYIRHEFERGDLVWVSFATHPIEQALRGLPDPDNGRLFSQENGVVMFGIQKATAIAPAEFSKSGLLIGHKNGDVCIRITEDEIKITAPELLIEGDVEIDGDLKVSGDIESEKDLIAESKGRRISGLRHGHNNVFGPTFSKIPQGEA